MKAIINQEGVLLQNKLNNFVQNEYGFDINFTIYEDDGSILDLTNSISIYFQVKSISGISYKVNGVCTIVDALTGKCKYTIQAVDFDEIGLYKAELDIIFPASKRSIRLGMFAVNEDI